MGTESRPVMDCPDEVTYLEQVERVAMGQLVKSIQAGDINGARAVVGILRELSIV